MLNFGLKLWTSNSTASFESASGMLAKKEADFIELYNNSDFPFDFDKFNIIKNLPVTIHNDNNHGFHEFTVGAEQLKIWEQTLKLADFFNSKHIVVHSGRGPTFEDFLNNLKKIDDLRILIENMPGFDMFGIKMYASEIAVLRQIKTVKEICFDLEKAIKAACYWRLDYKEYIDICLQEFKPFYFHISGGSKDSSNDEHKNLWEADFDFEWLGKKIGRIAERKDAYLVFETPKVDDDLNNDLKNFNFLKQYLPATV